MSAVDDILDFWFGTLDEHGCASKEHQARWWKKDAAFDDEIRRRFADLHQAIRRGEHDDWLLEPRGRLAQVIALDQFPRNMFRGTAEMFASDAQALRIAVDGIERGDDRALPQDHRSFFYMPLMHSEDLAMQDRAVVMFAALGSVKYAEMHRDIIRRFGRFPHRNRILGRESSPEELEFLAQPGSSF